MNSISFSLIIESKIDSYLDKYKKVEKVCRFWEIYFRDKKKGLRKAPDLKFLKFGLFPDVKSNSIIKVYYIFGYCLSECFEVLPNFRSSIISVNKDQLKRFHIQTGETEGLVNYPLSLTEVVFAGLIIEREDKIKLSMRSKGNFPANEFAAKYFEGGGHLNAAGGSFKGTLEDCVTQFKRGLEEYKALLFTV